MPQKESEYRLTTGQVARMLGVQPMTVIRYAASGALPCVVLPSGHRRFREADVVKLLKPENVA